MAFHSYPQVIRKLFNAYRFGPPDSFTCPSTCPRVDHLVSRPPPLTPTPSSDSLSLRLRTSLSLTLPTTVTRRFIMQKARRHGTKPLRPLVGIWFQGLLHSSVRGSFHLSLTVLCAIGRSVVFCLGWWSTLLPTRFHVSRGTLDTSPSALDFVYRSFTVCAQPSQIVRLSLTDLMLVLNPGHPKMSGLGSSLFARRY